MSRTMKMARTPLLEVIACTVEDAAAAEQGGADRIELVRELARGGLTPAVELVEAVVDAVSIPVRVMIREEEPFVVSSPAVTRALRDTARTMGRLRIEGLVLGFLDPAKAVDEALLGRVLGEAPGVRATFHRAFEEVENEAAAFAALERWPQIDRVLVTGGAGTAAARLATLRHLAAVAGPRVQVLAAVGSDRHLLSAVYATPELREAHVGRAAREPEEVHAPVSATK